MYKFTGFSEKADSAINNAITAAQNLGHTYVGSEHLLISLAQDTSSVAGVILNGRNITPAVLLKKLRSDMGAGSPTNLTVEDISPRLKKIIENALATGCKKEYFAGTEHLLGALLREKPSAASRLLSELGVSNAVLLSDMNRSLSTDTDTLQTGTHRNEKNTKQTLTKYSVNLTKAAAEGRIDPVACRDREIDRVIRILCRRTKNDPCLVGEPGVGKTAVAEGLAQRIVSGKVPDALKGKEIYSLELTGMVAGAKYRGDFEERIRSAVNEAVSAGNIILFIDEIHNLIGAGAAEGAVDAANILKPMLARGELRIIGATTIEEYRKTIAKDGALERRFQTVTVNEPSKEDTLTILQTLKSRYEEHHGCTVTEEALNAAVEMSERYITDRFFPDKAIDLIDEAAAKVRLRSEAENSLPLKSLFIPISGSGNEVTAVSLKEKPLSCELTVTPEDISEVISEWTEIPVEKLNEDGKEKLKNLEKELSESVTGQDKAVKTVAQAVIRGRTGIKDPKRPLGVFLFCGPTGVGKTELSKALAVSLFGTEDALIRLDMSEYSESHSVSKLIGSPPGYVGYGDSGSLAEKIRRKPYSVILFDEIEKAHPDIFNALLQLFEDGILTSADGHRANCRNSIIIMTSNAGDRLINECLPEIGFSPSEEGIKNATERAVQSELKKIFRPEFLNRIDSTVIFGKLTVRDLEAIAEKMLNELKMRVKANDIELNFTDKFIHFIAEKNLSDKNGARPLRRYITDEIETPLAGLLLESRDKKKITLTAENGEVIFELN